MITPRLFIPQTDSSSITFIKTKVKRFESYSGVDKPIDEQINKFVESNNVSIMDVKYIVQERSEVALVIYMEAIEV